LNVVSSVRPDEALFLSLDKACLFLLFIQWPRQIVGDFLHERLLGDRVFTGNIRVEFFSRLSSHLRAGMPSS
jgi:hypothetical protein